MAADHSTGPGVRARAPDARPLSDDYTPTRGQMAMLPNDNHPGSGCSCEYCMRRWPEQLPGDALAAIESQSEDCPAETRLALHTLRSAVSKGVRHG